MNSNNKSETAYKTIGEVTKELGLINQKTGRIQTHTIRYWETQFKQIKPIIRAGKRRYYSTKVFKIMNKSERIGRNPKTKVEAKISARKIIKFKPSLSIKEKLNTK